jgi:hypothetical protein
MTTPSRSSMTTVVPVPTGKHCYQALSFPD